MPVCGTQIAGQAINSCKGPGFGMHILMRGVRVASGILVSHPHRQWAKPYTTSEKRPCANKQTSGKKPADQERYNYNWKVHSHQPVYSYPHLLPKLLSAYEWQRARLHPKFVFTGSLGTQTTKQSLGIQIITFFHYLIDYILSGSLKQSHLH